MTKPSVLFYPGAGLGDTIVSLPVLAAVAQHLAGPIDILTRQSADAVAEVYYALPYIGKIIQTVAGQEGPVMEQYDILIIANEQVIVQIKPHAQPLVPTFIQLVQHGLKRREAFGIVNQVTDLLNNQLANHAVLLGLTRQTLPLYTLGLADYQTPKPQLNIRADLNSVLATHNLTHKNYITVQDGWDANFMNSNARPTKAWRTDAWQETVRLIKTQRPDLKIVQLGSSKSGTDITGVDLNLRGQVSLGDAFAILAGAILHIDTEGGLVHAAHALGTRSLVLFGPTNAQFFGYEDNINLVPPCNNCWWLKADWMQRCVRELSTPECMLHHTAIEVTAAVIGALKN